MVNEDTLIELILKTPHTNQDRIIIELTKNLYSKDDILFYYDKLYDDLIPIYLENFITVMGDNSYDILLNNRIDKLFSNVTGYHLFYTVNIFYDKIPDILIPDILANTIEGEEDIILSVFNDRLLKRVLQNYDCYILFSDCCRYLFIKHFKAVYSHLIITDPFILAGLNDTHQDRAICLFKNELVQANNNEAFKDERYINGNESFIRQCYYILHIFEDLFLSMDRIVPG